MAENNIKENEACIAESIQETMKKIKNRTSMKIFRAMPIVLIIFILIFFILAYTKIHYTEENYPSMFSICDKTMDLCIGIISSIVLLWIGSARIEYVSRKIAFPKFKCTKVINPYLVKNTQSNNQNNNNRVAIGEFNNSY